MKTKQAPETTELTRKEEVAQWAKERLSDPKTLILDVETTGLLNQDPKTEVVSISLINAQGRPVLSALVNPGRPIPMASQRIHGIDDRMVKDAPPWTVIGDLVAGIVHGKHIVSYNAGFDIHMIVTLFQRYEMEIPEFEVSCAMEEYSKFVGDWSTSKGDYRWQKLPKLAFGQAHDSLVDCQSTLMLMQKMAGDNSSDPTPEDVSLDF